MVKVKRKPIPYEENHKDIEGVIYKLCSDCNEWLLMEDNFYRNKKAPDGHNPYCKECTKKRSSKWTKANPEKYQKSKMKYRRTEHGKNQNRKWNAEYRERGGLQEWQRNNPDKLKGYNFNHMHKKHDIDDEEWLSCKKYFNHSCAYCGISEIVAKDTQGHYFHMEHAINHGTNDLSNCIPSCRICNSQKWTRDFDEWYKPNNEIHCTVFSYERLEKILKWLNEDYKLYIKQK